MIVKCGRNLYDLTEKDDILYNGSCYEVISRVYLKGFYRTTPNISMARAKQMIKDGTLVYDRPYIADYTQQKLKIYKIKEVEGYEEYK